MEYPKSAITLAGLITRISWEEVRHNLLTTLPTDHLETIEKYHDVLEELRCLSPKSSTMQLCLNDSAAGITAKNGEVDENGEEIEWGVDFTAWEEWLGMDIAPQTLHNYSAPEIVAECLWEMTWHGYNQESIQKTKIEWEA